MAKKRKEDRVEEVGAPEPQLVDFNVWFAMREKRIPKQHLKEIIWADFRGQGMAGKESLEDYDDALATYGIKLT